MRTHRLTRACRRVPGRDPGTCTGRHLWHRERLHPPNRQAYRCHFDPIPHIELPGRRRTECHTEARNDPMGRCRSCRPHTGPEEPPDDTRRRQGRTHAGAGAPPTSPRGSPARPGRQTAADEAATPLPAGLTTSAPSAPRRRATNTYRIPAVARHEGTVRASSGAARPGIERRRHRRDVAPIPRRRPRPSTPSRGRRRRRRDQRPSHGLPRPRRRHGRPAPRARIHRLVRVDDAHAVDARADRVAPHNRGHHESLSRVHKAIFQKENE